MVINEYINMFCDIGWNVIRRKCNSGREGDSALLRSRAKEQTPLTHTPKDKTSPTDLDTFTSFVIMSN